MFAKFLGESGMQNVWQGDAELLLKVFGDALDGVWCEVGRRDVLQKELQIRLIQREVILLEFALLNPDGFRLRLVVLVWVTLQLHQSALVSRFSLGTLHPPVLSNLGNVEPPADGHADAPSILLELLRAGSMVDLLDIVEGLAGLHGKERELVPGWWDRLDKVWQGCLGNLAVLALSVDDGEEAKSSAPLGLPWCVWVGKIQNVADFSRTDNIVVAQEVAAGCVDIDGHIGLAPTQGAAAGDVRNIFAEGLGVERIAEGEKGGELGQCLVVESVKVGKVTTLVDLVDVGLFGGEVNVGLDFFANLAQEGIVGELVDYAVFIRC